MSATAIKTRDRYRLGAPDARGRRAVFVDGAATATGMVEQIRRGSWTATTDQGVRTGHPTRHAAAAQLVGLVDLRAAHARRIAGQEAARATAPARWRFIPWAEVIEGEIVRVPDTRRIEDSSGRCYPVGWDTVRLSRLTLLDTGCVVVTGDRIGATAAAGKFVRLLTPASAELGALVEDVPGHDERRRTLTATRRAGGAVVGVEFAQATTAKGGVVRRLRLRTDRPGVDVAALEAIAAEFLPGRNQLTGSDPTGDGGRVITYTQQQ